MSMERSRVLGRRDMCWPHTHIGNNTTQNERFGVYEIFERKKYNDNISKMGKYEVCVPKLRIWVQGLLLLIR